MGDDAYGSMAKFYDRFVDPFNAPLRSTAVRLADVGPGMKVLDVGCGTGSLVEAMLDAGATAHGLDLSEAMTAVARERLGDRATIEIGDATAMPYADGSFDLICASLFLHELAPDVRDAVLTEMRRVTADAGSILVIDYRIGSLRFKGRMSRAVSTIAERLAGRDHHRNWKTFMATGGIPATVDRLGLTLKTEKIAAGGNISVWLIGH